MRAMKIEMIRRMAKMMVATMVIIVKTQNEGGNNVIRRVENEESVDYRVGGRKVGRENKNKPEFMLSGKLAALVKIKIE